MAHTEHPTPQADFIGILALVLMALAIVSALVVLLAVMNAG